MKKLHTTRLELVAGTYELCEAEITNPNVLARMLHAQAPDDWPPPLNDEQSQRYFLDILRNPETVGWCVWYVILAANARRVLIGNCGFKGQPRDGKVEIGYSIVPAFQRRGYASEAVNSLAQWAFADPRLERIFAETRPQLHASIGVLRKTKFLPCQDASEAGSLRFVRSRA